MAVASGDKSLTFGLDGEVSLAELATALRQFSKIAQALTKEVDGARAGTWLVSGLREGSAYATASTDTLDNRQFQLVNDRYLQLASELQARTIVSFPDPIAKPATTLLRLVSSRIPNLVFETAEETRIVSGAASLQARPKPLTSRGTLQGRVQTLTSRNALRFALYEPVFDRAVNCYIDEGLQEQLRGIWDKWAAVDGTITRHPTTGVPLAIRDIQRIVVLQTAQPGSYQVARGVLPAGAEAPEAIIRRVRDA